MEIPSLYPKRAQVSSGAVATEEPVPGTGFEEEYIGLVMLLWRAALGLTQDQVAAETGLAQSTISTIENGGSQRVENLRALAQFYGRTMGDLYGEVTSLKDLSAEHLGLIRRTARRSLRSVADLPDSSGKAPPGNGDSTE